MKSKLFLTAALFFTFSQLSGCGEPFNPEVNDKNCEDMRTPDGGYSEEYKKKFKTKEEWSSFAAKCFNR